MVFGKFSKGMKTCICGKALAFLGLGTIIGYNFRGMDWNIWGWALVLVGAILLGMCKCKK